MCSTSLKLSPYFAIRRTTRPTHSRNYNASRRDANNKSNNRRQQQKQRRRRRAQNVFYGLFKCLRKQQSETRCDVASDSAVTIVRAVASHCSLFCLLSLTPLSYSHLSLPSLTSLSHSPLPLTLSNSLKTPTPPYCV